MPDPSHQSQGGAPGFSNVDHDLSDTDDTRPTQSQRTNTMEPARDNIRPLTLKQVLRAKQAYSHKSAPWELDGQPIDNITVVASVISEGSKPETGRAWYRLIDGTNAHAVTVFRRFASEDIERVLPDNVDMLPRHRYVRVTGRLRITDSDRASGGRNTIEARAVSVVEDPHAVFYHVLNVMATEVALEKGWPSKEQLKSLSTDGIAGTAVTEGAAPPATQDASFAFSAPPTPARPAPPPRDVTPMPRAQAPRAPAQPRNDNTSAGTSSSTQRPAQDTRPGQSRIPAPEPESPVAGPSTSGRVRTTPSPPPRTPSPSPIRRSIRRISIKDPLSHLSTLQRQILLCVMDNQTEGADVSVSVITESVQNLDGVTEELVEEALIYLLNTGHIMSAHHIKGELQYRAVESGGEYGSISDEE